MKIGILSMQRVNNMGSLLQAYALKKIIEKEDHIVEFIDIISDKNESDLLRDSTNNFVEEGETNGWQGRIKKIDKYFINRLMNKLLLKKQYSLYEQFRVKYLDIDKKSSKYDMCVIGSDEVFNCQDDAPWGFSSQLFGNIPNADCIVTYAASCGATEIQCVPSKVQDVIRKSFLNISNFSVRDQNTLRFVETLTDSKNICTNLDPVFIYDFEKEIENTKADEIPNRKKEKYCIIYSYYNRIHDEESIDLIKNFCKKHSLRLIAIGAPQFWIKNYCPCSPFQCLDYFAGAEFVITDTFHGTIFAAKYSKNFAVYLRRSNNNKLLDLIKRIGIEKHIISKSNSIEEICRMTCEKSLIEKKRISELHKSLEYLNMCFGNDDYEQ